MTPMRLPRCQKALIQAAICLLAAVLGLVHNDHTALWNDEAFSFFAAQDGLSHTIRFIANDTHPPLYYLALNVWLGLGSSVFVIRALSAAAMTLALLPLYAAAKRLFDERVALLACLLFAIAPLDVMWAQRARPYPLQALLVAGAFWGLVRVWGAGEQVIGAGVCAAWRQRRFRPAAIDFGWFSYAVCGGLAMLTQTPAGFFLLGCNVAMMLAIVRDIRRNRILLLNWVVAQLLLILIWMLWLPVFLHQVTTNLTAAQIASKHAIFLVGFRQVLVTLQGLFGIAELWRPAPVFVAVYVVIAGFAMVRIARRRPAAWPLPVVICVPIAACLAGFFLVHPIFGYVIGTFLWMLVPYSVLIAYGILSLQPGILRWGVLAVVLAGNIWGVKNVYQTDTPPLDRVAALIRPAIAPNDGIVLSEAGSGRWGIAYYLGPNDGAVSGLDVRDWGNNGLIASRAEMDRLRRIWVIVPDGEAPATDMDALRRGRTAAFTERVGTFQVTRFDRITSFPPNR
jgi:4-amino-4-deoxy-L-arabinose transferase-like glycosyltransferase